MLFIGIGNLIPDPHYQDSGILQTLHGGHVNIHADLNQYPKYDMHRRVKVFLFLNPEWLESYGGHLEFWSTDLKNCNAKVCIFFEFFLLYYVFIILLHLCLDFTYPWTSRSVFFYRLQLSRSSRTPYVPTQSFSSLPSHVFLHPHSSPQGVCPWRLSEFSYYVVSIHGV